MNDSLDKKTVQMVAEQLNDLKMEEAKLKARKTELLSLLPVHNEKGTVTLKGETLDIKISRTEGVSYNDTELLEIIEDIPDWEDYYTMTLKEKKRDVESLLKTGTPIAKKIESIRTKTLRSPSVTVAEKKK